MLTALIVDDDKIFVDNLRFHLENPPDEIAALRFDHVDGAYSCHEAVSLARSGVAYDLIIYDLALPWEEGDPESRDNGIRLTQEIGPLQPSACGIVISGHADLQDAFLVGMLGIVRRLVQKPVRPETIMLVAQEAIMESTFTRLSAGYHLQARVHEAMNNLNNILAAASEIERMCSHAGNFVPSRSLPLIRGEIENIRKFQEMAEKSLRYVNPIESAKREPCDLARIAEWCVKYIKTQHPKQGDCLMLVADKHIPLTLGVSEELRQMILLLATNAIQAIGDRGLVEIYLHFEAENNPEIALTVQDNGKGIAAADQARIFEPSFTTRQGGSGQGLFLARRFAWNHGGRIQVESTEGVGTKVTVRLPLRGVQSGE